MNKEVEQLEMESVKSVIKAQQKAPEEVILALYVAISNRGL